MRRIPVTALAVVALAFGCFGVPRPVAAASAAKAVIVVGPTGSVTAGYKSDADSAAATLSRYTSNIVKVYSPNATWANVQAAAAGASILIYIGHGSGWPNPWGPYHQTGAPGDNGMGLNKTANAGDANQYYYGEDYMAQLGLAPNALVLLWHLCYASGNNEWDNGSSPTVAVARQRIDGYASGFIRAGASAVIADGIGDISPYISAVFSGNQTIDYIWRHAPNFHNNVSSWGSTHVDADGVDDYAGRGMLSQMDPNLDNPDGHQPYFRSMVARTGTLSAQIIGAPLNPNVGRWFGADRYGTASAVSSQTFAPGVPVAFVAVSNNFPDALAGAAAAGKLGGPVLLVAPTSIPSPTATELARLKPAKIVVLGSEGVISADVAGGLAAYAPAVERWAGTDRYETAAAVSAHVFDPGVPVAFVAVGDNFPDALSGAAAAANLGGPVLLVTTAAVPIATGTELTRLRPAKIVILGSTAVVNDDVASALKAFTRGTVERWSGGDRYATAASISAHSFAPGVAVAFVAVGTDFPDALSGAAAAGKLHAPVLLTSSGSLPADVATELGRLKPAKIVVLGSAGVVADTVLYQLGQYVPAP